MATTPHRANRFPALDRSDAADVPLWMNRLAVDLDDAPKDSQGVLSARPASGSYSGHYYWATDVKAWSRWDGSAWTTVARRQSFTSASLPGAFAVTSSNPATELDAGMRCTLPAAVGDVIRADLNLFVSGSSGSGPTGNIFAVHFLTLNDANAYVRGFPSRSGTFPAFFRASGFNGSVDVAASYRLQASDIRADGTVRVSVGVHTGGVQAVVGTATQDRTVSLANLGRLD